MQFMESHRAAPLGASLSLRATGGSLVKAYPALSQPEPFILPHQNPKTDLERIYMDIHGTIVKAFSVGSTS